MTFCFSMTLTVALFYKWQKTGLLICSYTVRF